MTTCEQPQLRVVLIALLAILAIEPGITQAQGNVYSGKIL